MNNEHFRSRSDSMDAKVNTIATGMLKAKISAKINT